MLWIIVLGSPIDRFSLVSQPNNTERHEYPGVWCSHTNTCLRFPFILIEYPSAKNGFDPHKRILIF